MSSRGTRDLLEIKTEADSSYRQNDKKVRTIYFGGGTPSVLSLDEVSGILECFPLWDSPSFRGSQRGHSDSTPPNLPYKGRNTKLENLEITFECNPEDITIEYVVGLFLLGINRISIGVQSLNNNTLKTIHRSDDGTIFSALDCIKSALESHKNLDISVNIDFILGLPHVERGETLENIERLHKIYPCITHTSVYILEKGLYPKSWKNHTLDDSLIQEEFIDILNYFESLGWNHYEFSNWSQSGYESRHNRGYWDHSNSRGFGLSAASYVDGKRWSNSDTFTGYYRGVLLDEEVLTPEQVCIEDMMFGLRTHGIDVSAMGSIIDTTRIDVLIMSGLLARDGDILKVTKTGIFLIDYIMAELISQ